MIMGNPAATYGTCESMIVGWAVDRFCVRRLYADTRSAVTRARSNVGMDTRAGGEGLD